MKQRSDDDDMRIGTPVDETATADATAERALLCGRSLRFGSFVGEVLTVHHCEGWPARVSVKWEHGYARDARCEECKQCEHCKHPWDTLEDDLTIEEVQSRLASNSPLQEAHIPRKSKIRRGAECAALCKLDQCPHSHSHPLSFSSLHSLAGTRLLYLPPSRHPHQSPPLHKGREKS